MIRSPERGFYRCIGSYVFVTGYSTGGVNQPCKLCGFGAISQPSVAATSFENCQCNALLGLQPIV